MKTSKEIGRPVRRQEERVALTREKIMSSAQKIFARDGFEASKLEEIASDAGYTRGAFYRNYKDKEELFVAVAEQYIENHTVRALRAVRSGTNLKSKIHHLIQDMSVMPETRIWVMVMIEFYLFTLRHPQQGKHLKSLNDQLTKGVKTIFEELYEETVQNPRFPLSIQGIGFYSLVLGLMLQERLNPHLITPKVSSELLEFYLENLLEGASKSPA
jgi:AcrR family transcriptional regulator